MNPIEQRIAIAEACGWSNIHKAENGTSLMGWWHGPPRTSLVIPDYLNDLNAMHEAIMAQPQDVRARINFNLAESFRPKKWILDQTVNATAAQRAEAFLKTLNLWKD